MKYGKKRMRLQHNPITREHRLESEMPIPFLHSLETTKQGRIYYFQPETKMPFSILVKFPIADHSTGLKVESAFVDVAPEIFIAALAFIAKNEMNFVEAFEDSQMSSSREDREPLEINDENFQKLC